MNKLLILFLAVCLVSVHAFVKRDTAAGAPPAQTDFLDNINKQFTEIGEKFKETFTADNINKAYKTIADGVSKAFNDIKPQEKPAN